MGPPSPCEINGKSSPIVLLNLKQAAKHLVVNTLNIQSSGETKGVLPYFHLSKPFVQVQAC